MYIYIYITGGGVYYNKEQTNENSVNKFRFICALFILSVHSISQLLYRYIGQPFSAFFSVLNTYSMYVYSTEYTYIYICTLNTQQALGKFMRIEYETLNALYNVHVCVCR